ncbi:MAG: hypothetical protein L0287_30075, partial [Anaerolineae bacterium]|nr:hypothetical protein [Anaerolineae bacterium]
EQLYYDPKPRLEVANAKAGKYYLKFMGEDGKEKVVAYQRPDCVDVIVIASATKSTSGYRYEYTVRNIVTSGCYLNGFAAQNFTTDISPKRPSNVNNVFIGDMSAGIFKEGNWIRFAPLPPHPQVQPGQTAKFTLHSSAPPGLVECRVDGGTRALTGDGGDQLPAELDALISKIGYSDWPRGFTIGPIDEIKRMSQGEKIAYLLNTLPKCQREGWMTTQALQTYERLLRRGDLQGIFTRIANDLKINSITTEVFGIIEGMRN